MLLDQLDLCHAKPPAFVVLALPPRASPPEVTYFQSSTMARRTYRWFARGVSVADGKQFKLIRISNYIKYS